MQVSSSLTDKPMWGSAGAGSSMTTSWLMRPGRALVNPFDPSNARVKLTSNRRRWTHIFPRGGGPGASSHLPLQNTGLRAGPAAPPAVSAVSESGQSSGSSCSGATRTTAAMMDSTLRKISDLTVGERTVTKKAGNFWDAARHRRVSITGDTVSRLGSFMWGVTGTQGDTAWDATETTGVDWRSITWPACLPITTDYFPDKRAFENDYVFNQYVIVPDEINSDYASMSPLQKPALTTKEVFVELICQRLSQGFQLIINQDDELSEMIKSDSITSQTQTSTISSLSLFLSASHTGTLNKTRSSENFWLSIGKNFHHISLTGNAIDVVIYRPRHPYPTLDYHYSYRFMAPDNDTYEVSWVEFNMEKLEQYGWNYLDHYVATRGDQDFVLAENLKYWRSRMYVLPLRPYVPFTTSIRDRPADMRCDVYKRPTPEEYVNLAEGFMRLNISTVAPEHSIIIHFNLRFVETCLNKIKRPTSNAPDRRKSRCMTMASGDLKGPGRSLGEFRSRVGSSSGHGLSRPLIDKAAIRDRVVSGPVHGGQDGGRRLRTESGGGRGRLELEAGVRPLVQTLAGLEAGTGLGSQDSVFTDRPTASVSNLESQVRPRTGEN